MNNNTNKTENELYNIVKNGINKDMSDDEVIRVIKYVMKNLPVYNQIKGTSNAIEMVLKMFSISCKIINLWYTTDADKRDDADFVEEQAIENFSNMYLTSKFNVEVYYSNLSFTEFTKNVALFVKLINNVKPVTRILNQISYIIDEFKEYKFYDCMQLTENAFTSETITFKDSNFGTITPFKNNDGHFYIPSVDENGNNVYATLLNMINTPHKNFTLTVSNQLTENNLYISIDGSQTTLNDILNKISYVKKNRNKTTMSGYESYINGLSTYLTNTFNIVISNANSDNVECNASETGVTVRDLLGTELSTSIRNSNILCSVISTLTSIIKDVYETDNVIIRCTGIEHPTTVQLSINHAKNTYSFGEV